MQELKIGFIGQGYIGKSYADDFEKRGHVVVRYALEEPYAGNKDLIKDCDLVFVAVPTPTTTEGFDDSIVRSAISLTKDAATVVIKSTILPGTTEALQESFPDKVILFSPEFLLEATAVDNAREPLLNIVGLPVDSATHQSQAELVQSLLPKSGYSKICTAREAELFKYAHNIHGVFRIMFTNILYDLAAANNCSWDTLAAAMEADPYFSTLANYYNQPVHKSGRGAGGRCFIKDLAAFREQYENLVGDETGVGLLRAIEAKNNSLLRNSGKDIELLKDIYGDTV